MENISWRQFEAGREYNRRVGLYENAAQNERFYRGDQWRSVNAGPLPKPVFNFIKPRGSEMENSDRTRTARVHRWSHSYGPLRDVPNRLLP